MKRDRGAGAVLRQAILVIDRHRHFWDPVEAPGPSTRNRQNRPRLLRCLLVLDSRNASTALCSESRGDANGREENKTGDLKNQEVNQDSKKGDA